MEVPVLRSLDKRDSTVLVLQHKKKIYSEALQPHFSVVAISSQTYTKLPSNQGSLPSVKHPLNNFRAMLIPRHHVILMCLLMLQIFLMSFFVSAVATVSIMKQKGDPKSS